MRIGVLGTGMVGSSIATKLVELGHEVMMGSRTRDNGKAVAWVEKMGTKARQGTFEDVAKFGGMLFNCVHGEDCIDALKSADENDLNGKILVDVSNPLDFSKGMPPTFLISNTDSLGEKIQRTFPKALVVKALNTVNAGVMTNPVQLGEDTAIFVSGNDAGAKASVAALLRDGFGWRQVIDLGDITTSRGTEMYLALWIRLMAAQNTPYFNIKIVKP